MYTRDESTIPFTDTWKKEGCVLEIDTDGLLVDKEADLDAINIFLKDEFENVVGIPRSQCVIEMDKERFERGFIHKMKNYILLEKKKDKKTGREADNVIIHGAYFKSSRSSKIYDEAVQNIIDYAIWDKMSDVEARNRSLDFKMRPIEDFTMVVKMSKNIAEYVVSAEAEIIDMNDQDALSEIDFNPITTEIVYTDGLSLSRNQIVALAKKMQAITGVKPEKGTAITYFIGRDPITGRKTYEYYNPVDETQVSRINYEAYEEMLIKLFESVGIATFNSTRQEDTTWTEAFLK